MREIKFRGFAIKKNNWVFGSLFKTNPVLTIIENAGEDMNDFNFVDFDSIGQYTGLKDKNGVEVYEGDVVKIQVNDRLDWNTIKGKVVFLEGAWLVEDVGSFAIELWSEMNEAEVIGNIYENPELLEGTK